MPARTRLHTAGHDVRIAPEMGWPSKSNGELLALAAAGEFDVFLTVDRNSYQQDLSAVDIAVVALLARRNALDVLRRLCRLCSTR